MAHVAGAFSAGLVVDASDVGVYEGGVLFYEQPFDKFMDYGALLLG